MQQTARTHTRILRQPAVVERVGVHPVTLYRWCRRGVFPPPVRLGPNSVGWPEATVESWLANRPTVEAAR